MRTDERRTLATYLAWRDSLPDLSAMCPEEAWTAFQDAHQGRCAICRNPTEKLIVDHCHETGLIRGLLCTPCNRNEWQSADQVYIVYGGWPPAHAAGLHRTYQKGWVDPASERWKTLWHAGPDGLESEWNIRQQEMIKAVQNRRPAPSETDQD